jgi:hypothetical protein
MHLPAETIALANQSVFLDLPPGFSADLEEDGTIAAGLESNPDLFTLRISSLSVKAKDNSQPVDLAADTITEAASKGTQANRAGDKAWTEYDNFSEQDAVPLWSRFWIVGFRNHKFIISLCCDRDQKSHSLVQETCNRLPELISTIRARPEKSPLTRMESEWLDEQREVILEVLRDRYDTFQTPKLRSDLNAIQQIIDDEVFTADQEHEWICLGVVFGDLLANELGLQWIMQSDEYGAEPALNLEGSSILLFPRTMLIKRIEQGEEPNLDSILEGLIEAVEDLRRKGC